jgi:hypothetical protein
MKESVHPRSTRYFSRHEEIQVARERFLRSLWDIGTIAHVSTRGSSVLSGSQSRGAKSPARRAAGVRERARPAERVRWRPAKGAKRRRTCPHYFTYGRSCKGYNTLAKSQSAAADLRRPPAILEGIRDGTIDMIVTRPPRLHHEMRNR